MIFFMLFEIIYTNFQTIKMQIKLQKNERFQYRRLFDFNHGSKTVKAARENCDVYGKDAMAQRTTHNQNTQLNDKGTSWMDR